MKEREVGPSRWYRIRVLSSMLLLLNGCIWQAPYMQGWETVEGIDARWTGGRIVRGKLSQDEAAVFEKLGAPEAIRFFRAMQTRQRVYEWVYLAAEQTVWFVEGKRVDYVTVEDSGSVFTRAERQTIENKFTTGGLLGVVVGGVAAGVILGGKTLGLRD